MGGDDLLDDRQAETAAAGVAGAGLVEPHEPVEDALALVLGDPGAVVVDDELDAVIGLADGEGDAASACRAALSTRFCTTCASAAWSPRTRPAPTPEVSTRETGPADTAGLRQRQVVEVDVVARPRDRALVGPGEQQQLLHEPLHPRGLLEHGVGELALGQGARVRARHLGRLADAGQR